MNRDVLFATFEGGGNVPPMAGAMRRLRDRGHRVRVLADDCCREDFETAGAAFVPWRTAYNRPNRRKGTDPLRDWEATEPGGGLIRVLDGLMIGPAAAYAADTVAELRREAADVVVSCDLLFGPMIAAEATGTKLAILSPNISIAPIPGMPPIGPGMPPPATDEERTMAQGVAAWLAAAMGERLPVLNAARAGLGLGPLGDPFDQIRAADMVLLATSRAFDFPVPALPPGMRYVGPLLDQPAWAGDWHSPWPATDRRPLIVVAMSSTFQNQAPAIRRVLDAASALDVRVLVTLGPGLEEAEIAAPANAVIVRQASHDQLMEEASVVVTHCGHGTVMRALAHRCPMLCLPMGRDQNDNAARVVAHGAGLRLTAETEAGAIRAALTTLLADPSFRMSAAALGEAIAAAEPADAFAQAVEELTARPRRRAAA